MPAEITSKIAWKSLKQKKRAQKYAKKWKQSLSSIIQNHFDVLTHDER